MRNAFLVLLVLMLSMVVDRRFRRVEARVRPVPLPSVVLVHADDGGTGSAVALTDRWVITAKHVLPISSLCDSPVTKVVEHPVADLALVQIQDPQPWRCAPIAAAAPNFGDPVYAVGWHLGDDLLVTSGYQGSPPVAISAPIVFGASGGAVLNSMGELVGLLRAIAFMERSTNSGEPFILPVFHDTQQTPVVEFGDWIRANLTK